MNRLCNILLLLYSHDASHEDYAFVHNENLTQELDAHGNTIYATASSYHDSHHDSISNESLKFCPEKVRCTFFSIF